MSIDGDPLALDRAVRRRELLWQHDRELDGDFEVFAIIDCARDRRIHDLLEREMLEDSCLFLGPLHPRLRRAAPYVVNLSPKSHFTREFLTEGWGRAWGIVLRAPAEMVAQDVRRHFRRFLQVKDESGRKLLFRYYDPRVLAIYLPTCTQDELKTVFGPVHSFYIETEDPEAVQEFRRVKRGLKARKLPIGPPGGTVDPAAD